MANRRTNRCVPRSLSLSLRSGGPHIISIFTPSHLILVSVKTTCCLTTGSYWKSGRADVRQDRGEAQRTTRERASRVETRQAFRSRGRRVRIHVRRITLYCMHPHMCACLHNAETDLLAKGEVRVVQLPRQGWPTMNQRHGKIARLFRPARHRISVSCFRASPAAALHRQNGRR